MMAAPEEGPALLVALCHRFNFTSDCDTTYGKLGLGPVITQVAANADVGGFDGQVRVSVISRQNVAYQSVTFVFLDALPTLPRILPPSPGIASEPYGMVCKAQA